MAKIVYLCPRVKNKNLYQYHLLTQISRRVIPDNITPHPPVLITHCGLFIGIINPNDCLLSKNASVCLGNILAPTENWWQPLSEKPEGTYALFRGDANFVEIITDIVASRTIWYCYTEQFFIASSSQRIIVIYMQSFVANPKVFPWILSSGLLGPGFSWDQRIRFLEPDSRLILDRSSWELKKEEKTVVFTPVNLPEVEHKKSLETVLVETFDLLDLDYDRWVLLLSGGIDSRAILLFLKNKKNLKCITWGEKSALNQVDNDACLAKSLAEYFNLEHRYFELNMSNESSEKIFHRFIIAGEGRIDHIAAYIDGFNIWKWLFEHGIVGVIRGDHCFGWRNVNSLDDVWRNSGALTLPDYFNREYITKFGFEPQSWPERMHQAKNESLMTWRDRLYLEFRLPVRVAALNDLKCSYVDIINPFFSRRIVEQIRTIPNHLCTNKQLFKEIVQSLTPNINFARYSAIVPNRDILKTQNVVNYIYEELNTSYARSILPGNFIDFVLKNLLLLNKDLIKTECSILNDTKHSLNNTGWNIDINILAFRAFIICKMNQVLADDAKFLK